MSFKKPLVPHAAVCLHVSHLPIPRLNVAALIVKKSDGIITNEINSTSESSTQNEHNIDAHLHDPLLPASIVDIASEEENAVRNTEEDTEDPNRLYCICRQSHSADSFMIACETCSEWYHGNCVHVTEQEAESMNEWVCQKCLGVPFPKKRADAATKRRAEEDHDLLEHKRDRKKK